MHGKVGHAFGNPPLLGRRLRQFRGRLLLGHFGTGISCHVTTQRKKGSHADIDLRKELQQKGGRLGKAQKVAYRIASTEMRVRGFVATYGDEEKKEQGVRKE